MRCVCFTVWTLVLIGSSPAQGDETPAEWIDAGRELLGTSREKEGRELLEKAIRRLDEKIKQEPQRDELRFELGRAHYYLEQDEPAIAAFNQAIKLNARHAGAHFLKGLVLRQQDKLDDALPELEKAKTLDPKNADYWCEWGSALFDQGDNRKARAALEEAVRLAPKLSAAIYTLGVLDVEDGKTEAGLARYRRVIELEPSWANAHYNAGQACQTLGRHAEALKHFRAAAKIEADDVQTAAKIVQCCQALNRLKQRDRARERVLNLHKAGKSKQKFYCRDQFHVGKLRVLGFEYFELQGDEPVRYSFQVRRQESEDPEYRISLGSYNVTDEFARSQGMVSGEERLYHLDRYHPSGKHETYAFFKGEPDYDQVREMVELIIKGKKKPSSSMTPTSQETPPIPPAP